VCGVCSKGELFPVILGYFSRCDLPDISDIKLRKEKKQGEFDFGFLFSETSL